MNRSDASSFYEDDEDPNGVRSAFRAPGPAGLTGRGGWIISITAPARIAFKNCRIG